MRRRQGRVAAPQPADGGTWYRADGIDGQAAAAGWVYWKHRTGPPEETALLVAGRIVIPDAEFHWSFVRAGGPGGQNVNKVASRAVLRWDVAASPSLPPDIKARLRAAVANRLTVAGELILSSQRFRDQERNRRDCLAKLGELIERAAIPPKLRKPTRRTAGSRHRRLEAKRHRARVKGGRRRPEDPL
jgi:ribosome-associated protein